MGKENTLKYIFPGSDAKYNDSRVFFSKFDMSGLHDFHEYSTESELFKYLEFGPHKELSDSIEYINKVEDRILNGFYGGPTMYWFLRLRGSKKVIGSMVLYGVNFDTGVGWIGKGLSPAYWGNGYMFEAMGIYLDYCRDALGLKEIKSYTRHDNKPNIKLMKKYGFKIIKEIESFYKNEDGITHNAVKMHV